MNTHTQATLSDLSVDEITQIAGGVSTSGIKPVQLEAPQAQDMYGNTMSHEDWMNHKLDPNGSIHDFYESGFDSNKPNIWYPTRR